MIRPHFDRRAVAFGLAVVALAGLSLASASQLSINGGTLQAGSAVVGSCQPAAAPVAITMTSAFSSGAYRTTAVTLAGVDAACDGLQYSLQLVDTSGVPIDLDPGPATDVTGNISLSGGAFTVAVPSTATASVGSVAVVFRG